MEPALPTLSLEARLADFCREQNGISADFLAALPLPYGRTISASRLRVALRGEKDLEAEDNQAVETLFRELRAIAEEHLPFKVQWSDPRMFREELEKRRRAKIQVRSPFTLPGPTVQSQPATREQIESALDVIHGRSLK